MAEQSNTFAAHTGRPLPPSRQRATVYDRETGEALVAFPVDARELVASGHYTTTPPATPAPADPPVVVGIDPAVSAADVSLAAEDKPSRSKRR